MQTATDWQGNVIAVQRVRSGNIKAIGWADRGVVMDGVIHTRIGTLRVEFLSGSVYDYAEIPQSIFDRLLAAGQAGSAESVGKLFDQLVKSSGYKFAKVK